MSRCRVQETAVAAAQETGKAGSNESRVNNCIIAGPALCHLGESFSNCFELGAVCSLLKVPISPKY